LEDIVDRTLMATRSLTADDKTAGPIDGAAAGAARMLRYQLNVVASTTAEVVESAGGWLCDRARAGWDVNVLVAGGGDPRPLTILGATSLDLDESLLVMVQRASRGEAMAISADLLGADKRVRSEVLRVLKCGLADVTVWGTRWPAELGRQADSVQHRVSTAARAFKSHALVAADVSANSVTPTEMLFRIRTGSFRPLYSV
jgi:hypothetical protein